MTTTPQDYHYEPELGSVVAVKHKSNHKVKFSMGEEEETEPPNEYSSTLPNILDVDEQETSPPNDSSQDVVAMRDAVVKQGALLKAHDNATRLASRMDGSAPPSRRNSMDSLPTLDPLLSISPNSSPPLLPLRPDDIAMLDIENDAAERGHFGLEHKAENEPTAPGTPSKHESDKIREQAAHLVRTFTRRFEHHTDDEPERLQPTTSALDKDLQDIDYVPVPAEYRTGILATLMRVYDGQSAAAIAGRTGYMPPSTTAQIRKRPPRIRQPSASSDHLPYSNHESDDASSSAPVSGKSTPLRKQKWYDEKPRKSPPPSRTPSVGSLTHLLKSSVNLAAPGLPFALDNQNAGDRPGLPRSKSSGMIATAVDRLTHPSQNFRRSSPPEDQFFITKHIAEVLANQQYLETLCRSLMMFGAPTYRMEELMIMSARVLRVKGQFLYLPNCMIISFDDTTMHTTEVHLVKQREGVDLGKFQDTFVVYKNVVHDRVRANEATEELNSIMERADKVPRWIRVLTYGLASVSVGPFAFQARPIDFPFMFVLGCILGYLQLVVAPRSDQFRNVFEVLAAVVTSFCARGLGSIVIHGKQIFCFSAMAQSSIALILPGYIILCAALELQSRNIVAGSVRMVYAIIYALFLGFGITIGTALFGLMWPKGATSAITCHIPPYWSNTMLTHWPFVPIFTFCLIVINQAKWSQSPAMLLISFAGYQTNFWVSKRLGTNIQVANAVSSFVIGVLANLYARRFHGLAAATMLPAIFVQVPSGLAASGSLVAGLTSANQLTGNATGISVVTNGTSGFVDSGNVYGGTIFNVGYGMVQVAIGISVGLCLSALVVYPMGKRRSGLFSF